MEQCKSPVLRESEIFDQIVNGLLSVPYVGIGHLEKMKSRQENNYDIIHVVNTSV